MRGAWAVTVKLNKVDDSDSVFDCVERLGKLPVVARAEIWLAIDEPARALTREEEMRGGDKKISSCLLVETLREASARRLAAEMTEVLSDSVAETGIYRLLCDLVAFEASALA